jgi:hypothetical protein
MSWPKKRNFAATRRSFTIGARDVRRAAEPGVPAQGWAGLVLAKMIDDQHQNELAPELENGIALS